MFHKMTSLGNKKTPLLPRSGTRTESIFCGTTLFAAEAATSTGCQHIRCPITLAMRQKILRLSLFPLPSTVHLPTRFSLRSQLCGTLCGCAADFTSVSTVSYLRYAYYTPTVSACQELFSTKTGKIGDMGYKIRDNEELGIKLALFHAPVAPSLDPPTPAPPFLL